MLYLTAHMKTHIAKDTSTKDGNKEKKKCSTCNYETYKNFNLKKHMKTQEKIKSTKTNVVVIFVIIQQIRGRNG